MPHDRPGIVFIVPGRLADRTGGYLYDRRMIEGLRARGWTVAVHELAGDFPRPAQDAISSAAVIFEDLPDGTVVVADGLALGALADIVQRESARLGIVALVHLPLGADVGIDRDTARSLEVLERRALAAVRTIVVTGQAAVSLLAATSLAAMPDKAAAEITVVEPGTDAAPLARGSGSETVHLLSVATVNGIKGHDVLIEALASIPQERWHLTCAGSLTRDPATATRVAALIRRLGVEDKVTLTGELGEDALSACFDSSDVFVLATLRETYGMAVAEALARGLPVVATRTGAIPTLVGEDAGILVPPGESRPLAAALSVVIGDATVRQRMADGARRMRTRLRSWDVAINQMDDVVTQAARWTTS